MDFGFIILPASRILCSSKLAQSAIIAAGEPWRSEFRKTKNCDYEVNFEKKAIWLFFVNPRKKMKSKISVFSGHLKSYRFQNN
jgi:hypothetical protein